MVFKKKQRKAPEFKEEDYAGDIDQEENPEEEDYEEEPEEEEEEEEYDRRPIRRPLPKKKITVQDILIAHEQRLQALESSMFRLKSI